MHWGWVGDGQWHQGTRRHTVACPGYVPSEMLPDALGSTEKDQTK